MSHLVTALSVDVNDRTVSLCSVLHEERASWLTELRLSSLYQSVIEYLTPQVVDAVSKVPELVEV